MILEYEPIGKGLDGYQAAKLIIAINRSKKIELTDKVPTGLLSHIYIKGTFTPIGYISSDNQLEKVNPKDESLKPYHKFLEGLYKIITNASKI